MGIGALTAELLALVLLVMITVCYYDKRTIRSNRRRLFELSLCMAGLSILLNGISVYMLTYPKRFSFGWMMTANSAYFLVAVYSTAAVASYLFDLMLEHVYSKRCRLRAVVGVSVMVGLFTLLVIANVWNGWLFSIDSAGIYHRGFLNRAGYLVMAGELVMIVMCYQKNCASIGENVRRTIFMMMTVTLLLTLFQLMFPALLLNGIINVFAILIIYVNSQNFRMGRDSLTGIGNRKSFFEELFLRLRGKEKFLVVMLSLNRFDLVNQKYGYQKGDEFLFLIGNWMNACQKDGRAFRFGNVTFAMVCPYVDEESEDELIDRLKERFSQTWVVGSSECEIGASFATMVCNVKRREATQVIEILNFLISHAKLENGSVVKFDSSIEKMFQEEQDMERMIPEAIEQRMFEAWYQPIYNCKEQCFDTVEVLLRMRDHNGRLVSPAKFIPLAEKNGMINQIGQFVWGEVCRFMGEHPEISLKCVSVNMSAQQFQNQNLCDEMEAEMIRYGVSASNIKLEVTERMIIDDEKCMKQQMKKFSEHGFCFAADDFGVGYSNLASVMHLPFEFIKFDRTLLETLPYDEEDRMVIQDMVELFHKREKKIVAEGVETWEQKKIVEEMGADYIQGFYYAKPMSERDFLAFLRENS